MTAFSALLDRPLLKLNGGSYGDIFGVDMVASILLASNILDVVISDAMPGDTSKLWFDPDTVTPASGVYKIWDVPTGAWVPLTPLRFMQWIVRRGGQPVPTGAIQAYGGPAAPSGWLLCNGAAVSRATYADLFAIIGTTYGPGDGATTFNLPDLRGEFLRGVDAMGGAGRGADPGRTLGSNQADELKAHTHTFQTSITGSAGHAIAGSTPNPTDTQTTTPTGGSETRPRNVAVTYLIKT